VNEGSSSSLSGLLGGGLQRGELIKLRGAMGLLWWPAMLAGGG
jgi:hypothetical protein